MPLYEHVFLARQDVTAQQVETMVETYKGVIETGGGTIEKIESWGVKSLAYRIKKNRKAHFTLLNVDAPPAALAEMERQMQISEDVLRFMTVRVEQLEAEPSAMMQKRDRDERKDRERGRRRDDDGHEPHRRSAGGARPLIRRGGGHTQFGRAHAFVGLQPLFVGIPAAVEAVPARIPVLPDWPRHRQRSHQPHPGQSPERDCPCSLLASVAAAGRSC